MRHFEVDSAQLQQSPARRIGAAATVVYRPGGGGVGRTIEEWHPDIVHFHNLWPLLTPAALRIAKRGGAAVVLTAHNYRFACPGGTLIRGEAIHEDCLEGSSLACGLRNPRGAISESIAYGIALEIHRRLHFLERWVDAFIAPSQFMGRMLVRARLPERRVHVIPHGVPLPTARPDRPDRRFALFAGRLSEEKGIRTLLEASRIASDVPLSIAGDGPLLDEVVASPVSYLGNLQNDQLENVRLETTFSVVPSEFYESFGFSVIEAFAAGVPVIGTRLGAIPELVHDNVTGLLVAPRSPGALARAMQLLWHDPALAASLGRQSLRLAGNFSVEQNISSTIALYESIVPARS